VANRQLWLLGEKSSEVWYDSGNPDFPFTRVSGAVTDIGCASYTSIARVRDSVLFVGNDFKVYATNGYSPVVVSTPAVEKDLDEGNTSLISAFTFNNEGHWFYVLHLTDKTYVYDLLTRLWHNRTTGDLGKWFIEGGINRAFKNIPVGYSGSNMFSLSIDYYYDDIIPIKREFVSTPINKGVNRFTLHEVQLDMEVSEETDAEVVLTLTGNAGRTWSNRHSAYMGKDGQDLQRVRWKRLGRYRDCTLKIIITDPVKIRISGLYGMLT
jgi:hypothetical protein